MTYSQSTWRKFRRSDFVQAVLPTLAVIAGILLAIAVVFTLLFGGINTWDRAIKRNECENWSQSSGYTVRWQDNSFWSFDCMAKTQTGKWLPIDQLREVDR